MGLISGLTLLLAAIAECGTHRSTLKTWRLRLSWSWTRSTDFSTSPQSWRYTGRSAVGILRKMSTCTSNPGIGTSSWWSLRSMGRPSNKQLLGKHKQGTTQRREREEKVKEVVKCRAAPTRATHHAGCSSKAGARTVRSASTSTRQAIEGGVGEATVGGGIGELYKVDLTHVRP